MRAQHTHSHHTAARARTGRGGLVPAGSRTAGGCNQGAPSPRPAPVLTFPGAGQPVSFQRPVPFSLLLPSLSVPAALTPALVSPSPRWSPFLLVCVSVSHLLGPGLRPFPTPAPTAMLSLSQQRRCHFLLFAFSVPGRLPVLTLVLVCPRTVQQGPRLAPSSAGHICSPCSALLPASWLSQGLEGPGEACPQLSGLTGDPEGLTWGAAGAHTWAGALLKRSWKWVQAWTSGDRDLKCLPCLGTLWPLEPPAGPTGQTPLSWFFRPTLLHTRKLPVAGCRAALWPEGGSCHGPTQSWGEGRGEGWWSWGVGRGAPELHPVVGRSPRGPGGHGWHFLSEVLSAL